MQMWNWTSEEEMIQGCTYQNFFKFIYHPIIFTTLKSSIIEDSTYFHKTTIIGDHEFVVRLKLIQNGFCIQFLFLVNVALAAS